MEWVMTEKKVLDLHSEALHRLDRIGHIHEYMVRELPPVSVPVSVGTVVKAAAHLAQVMLAADDPLNLNQKDRGNVLSAVGDCFILLTYLCGELKIDPLTLIDEVFATQQKGLVKQREVMKAMQDSMIGEPIHAVIPPDEKGRSPQ